MSKAKNTTRKLPPAVAAKPKRRPTRVDASRVRYRMEGDCIRRLSDNALIPVDEGNGCFQQFVSDVETDPGCLGAAR